MASWSSGSVLATVARLVVISVIVGLVLTAFDLQPQDLLDRIGQLARRLYDMGFGAVEQVFSWFLTGAVIVAPIWLLSLLLGRRRAASRDRREGE